MGSSTGTEVLGANLTRPRPPMSCPKHHPHARPQITVMQAKWQVPNTLHTDTHRHTYQKWTGQARNQHFPRHAIASNSEGEVLRATWMPELRTGCQRWSDGKKILTLASISKAPMESPYAESLRHGETIMRKCVCVCVSLSLCLYMPGLSPNL